MDQERQVVVNPFPIRNPACRVAFVAVAAGAMLAGAAAPLDAAGSTSYHIGNSLTWDIVPAGVEALAALRGREHRAGYHIAFSQNLNSIWSNPTSTSVAPVSGFGTFPEALAGSRLDAVTLQPWHNQRATLTEDTARMLDFIELTRTSPENDATEFFIFTGWPRLDLLRRLWPQAVEDDDETRSTTAREYFELLADRVQTLSEARVFIIPVGEVFFRIDQKIEAGEMPGLMYTSDLYRDLIHASYSIGRYIAGVTTYATLFGEDPAGLVAPEGFYSSGSSQYTPELYEAVHAIVWDAVREHSRRFAGDYNGNGLVDQGDLDLVLAHWGDDAQSVPPSWRFHLPSGRVDQDELDRVLIHWGGPVAPLGLSAVPEPGSGAILACLLFCLALPVACGRYRRLCCT